jgi:hypothetical protein
MNALSSKAIFRSALIIILFTSGVIGWAQTTATDDDPAKETQARGYWVDPSTGLMWTAKDNGRDVNWHNATSYCSKLRLAGYADWRLGTIDELQELIDVKAHKPEHVGDSSILHLNIGKKMPGGLQVEWRVWSSSRLMDVKGKPGGMAWYFDFVNVRRSSDGGDVGLADSYELRALCVRASGTASQLAQVEQAPSTYSDPTTGLTWEAKDNGKDVNLGEAISYCRDLREGGSSGWRLATIEELEAIQADPSGKRLALTGNSWSSSPLGNDSGYEPIYVWYLSQKSGTRVFDDPSFSRAKRAVCVRDAPGQHGPRSGAARPSPEQETQERGYWSDPSTGLMWAARSGLRDTSLYMDATYSCQKLKLAGHSDWRLATISELDGIYDSNAESPGAIPRTDWEEPEAALFHIKGNLFLTGLLWVNTSGNDDRNPDRYRSLFDFKEGKPVSEKRYFVRASALCVRGPGG